MQPFHIFFKKFSRNLLIGLSVILLSLGIGMMGYHHYEKMNWVDSYLNAAMILSGMGPASPIQTEKGKIFAGSYALFSGILFLVMIAFILAPVIHRLFHKWHLEYTKEK